MAYEVRVSLAIPCTAIIRMQGICSCDGTNADDYLWLNVCMNVL